MKVSTVSTVSPKECYCKVVLQIATSPFPTRPPAGPSASLPAASGGTTAPRSPPSRACARRTRRVAGGSRGPGPITARSWSALAITRANWSPGPPPCRAHSPSSGSPAPPRGRCAGGERWLWGVVRRPVHFPTKPATLARVQAAPVLWPRGEVLLVKWHVIRLSQDVEVDLIERKEVVARHPAQRGHGRSWPATARSPPWPGRSSSLLARLPGQQLLVHARWRCAGE